MSIRRRAARAARRLGLHRLAYRIHPHTLRCRRCGVVFVQYAAGSLRHADDAYDHYIEAHEATA